MALPVYTYLIADLATNVVLEEIRLHGVSFNKPLNASGRFDGTVKLGRRTRQFDMLDLTAPGRRCIYALRDDRPMWGGIIWTRSYSSRTQTLRIGAGEWWSYFDHRYVVNLLPASPGPYDVAELPAASWTADRNQVARELVALAQSHTGGNLLVEPDTSTSADVIERNYQPWKLTNTGEALRDLTNVIDGADLVFDVAPAAAEGGAPRRVMVQGTPYLGQQGSSHVWELGGNVSEFEWDEDATRMGTRAYATGEGVDLGTPIAVDTDVEAFAAGYPLLEIDADYDSDDFDVLTGHAQGDREAARLPVVLPKIVTRGDLSPTAAEIGRGDDGRLVIPRGDLLHRSGWDAAVRVVDMAFSPSASAERVTLTLAPILGTA